MAGQRPKSGPTMHDVAAAAGVSQATVSLVLNSASGSRFSEDTRRRVRDAVGRRSGIAPTPTPKFSATAWPA